MKEFKNLHCWIVNSRDMDNVYLQVGDAMKKYKPHANAKWIEHHWEVVFKDETELGKFVMSVIDDGATGFGMSEGYDQDGNVVNVIFVADIYYGFELGKEELVGDYRKDK